MGAATVGEVNIILSGNSASFSKALDEAQRKLDQLKKGSQAAGHSTVSSVQAASAALREMNGDITNNIRAVERFITTIPGASTALKAMFPLVGGLAFGAMLFELGKKVADFQKGIAEAQQRLQAGFRAMEVSTQTQADNLRLVNDRLQNEIDKLQSKPQNNLAMALDEARIKADGLASSTAEALNRVKELIEQNKISFMTSLVSGKDSTNDVAGTVMYYRGQIAEQAYNLTNATHRGDKAGMDEANKKLASAIAAYAEWLETQIKTRTGKEKSEDSWTESGMYIPGVVMPYAQLHGDQTGNLTVLRSERANLYAEDDLREQQERNAKLVPQKAGLEAAKSLNEKANRDRLRAEEVQLGRMKLAGNVSAKAEYDYWAARINAFSQGSEQYKAVQDKLEVLGRSGSERASKAIAEARAGNMISAMDVYTGGKRPEADGAAEANQSIERGNRELQQMQQRTAQDAADAAAERAVNSQRQSAALREIQINAAAGRSISELDAARQIAFEHQRGYQEELDRLTSKRNNVANSSWLTADEKQKALDEIDSQSQALTASRNDQIQRDNDATSAMPSSALVGFEDSINSFVSATRDWATITHSFTNDALKGFNDLLVQGMSTRNFHWSQQLGNYGAGLFRKASGSLLEGAEGKIFGAPGFGKQGTASNPMYVKNVDGAASGELAGLGRRLFDGFKMPSVNAAVNAASGAAQSGGMWSGFGKLLTSFIPGFAGGVNNFSGGMAWVGEQGPELLNLPAGSSVVPNHKATGYGGDTHHHWNIDARGASDPAAVRAQVQQGIAAATPHIMRGTYQMIAKHKRDTPSSRRGW